MNTTRWGLVALLLLLSGFVLGRYAAPPPAHASAAVTQTPAPVGAIAFVPVAAKTDQILRTGVGEEPLEKAALRVGTTPANGAAFDELLHSLRSWAASDPLAAVAYARDHLTLQRQNQAVTEILRDWVKTDAAAAWTWATTNVPENGTQLDAVLSHIAEVNGPAAWGYATEFAQTHPSAAQSTYASALRGITYKGDFQLAVQLLRQTESLTDGAREGLSTLVASEWGRYEPDKAVTWVNSLPAQSVSHERAMINVVQAWAEVNPVAAAKYATQLPPGGERQQAVTQALPNWASIDPAAAAQWLFSQEPSRDFDQAVYAIATHSQVMSDFSSAVTLATSIHDQELRTQSLTRIVASLQQRNRAAASTFLQTSTEISPEMIASIRLRLAANDLYATGK